MDTLWQSFWLVVEIFFFVAYLVVLFQIVADLFRDREQGGFAKAVWVFFLIAFPLLTALVYLIARGKGMGDRQVAAMHAAQQHTDDYIREVAGTSPAHQIELAKKLLDDGAITPEEYASLKADALTGKA
ncbi:SHOCT domain-containing protein [Cellulomonas citrea]|uniref:SHOCT domain-containing protein n=1 Tax=Cellulomonas citrea TaxID=1909423 RepID=UPI001356E0F1|nr:SHOCT domain-containing protein [Cellulomonas citrea]